MPVVIGELDMKTAPPVHEPPPGEPAAAKSPTAQEIARILGRERLRMQRREAD